MQSSRSSPRMFDSPPPRLPAYHDHSHVLIRVLPSFSLPLRSTCKYTSTSPPSTTSISSSPSQMPVITLSSPFDWMHTSAAIRPARPANVLAHVEVYCDHSHIRTCLGMSVYFNSHRNTISTVNVTGIRTASATPTPRMSGVGLGALFTGCRSPEGHRPRVVCDVKV